MSIVKFSRVPYGFEWQIENDPNDPYFRWSRELVNEITAGNVDGPLMVSVGQDGASITAIHIGTEHETKETFNVIEFDGRTYKTERVTNGNDH